MKNSSAGFLVGLFSGAALGAAIGILYAPEKGSETREKLKEKAIDFKSEIEDLKDQIIEMINDLKKEVVAEPEKKTTSKAGGSKAK